MLQFPSNFDPAKTYPMLVSVYGGPGSNGLNENFANANRAGGVRLPDPEASMRAPMLGKRPEDSRYAPTSSWASSRSTTIAAGIRALWSRPYVDRERVGMYGTSYGGTVAAASAVAPPGCRAGGRQPSSPVDGLPALRHGLFTERHLGLPQTDADAYDRAAAVAAGAPADGATC
jgi:dipeptidyl-peptidase-4